jgi:hypothetical protein
MTLLYRLCTKKEVNVDQIVKSSDEYTNYINICNLKKNKRVIMKNGIELNIKVILISDSAI